MAQRDGSGRSALHYGCLQGKLDVVRRELQRCKDSGGCAFAPDGQGQTPFMLAVREGHVDCAWELLNSGCCVEPLAEDCMNRTAAHWAIQRGHCDLFKEIVTQGCQQQVEDCKVSLADLVNSKKTMTGETFLHWAAKESQMPIVSWLLQVGASPNVPSVRGDLPVDLADPANRDLIKLLQEAMCKSSHSIPAAQPPSARIAPAGPKSVPIVKNVKPKKLKISLK